MKIRIKLAIAFVLGLLIIGGVGIQSYLEIQRLSEANRWVVHTHKVIEGLENIFSMLKDAETGQRGYSLLTDKDNYLEPYSSALLDIPNAFINVASLIKDNPQQVKSLQQLHELSFEKLAVINETIKLHRVAGLTWGLRINSLDRGKHIMDQIRAIIYQMITRERILLEGRNNSANKFVQVGSWWVGIGMFFAMGILGVAAVIATKTISFINQELQVLSMTDPLTGVLNRRGFEMQAHQYLNLIKRNKQHAFLFFIDVDNMKRINDNLGHNEGDAVLIEVAGILKKCFRESDIVTRLGGDEFSVLVAMLNAGDEERIVKRLQELIDQRNSACRPPQQPFF
jgi:diguanylate cyclase (GGDEF)-like protein